MIKSLYIHIPFCKNICSYCDFCKMFYGEEKVLKYLDSLALEIEKNYHQDLLETIYVGGGTPSSLSTKAMDKLFSIINTLNLAKDIEFSFECNISDITEDLLIKLAKNKVNRLSIGIQSFNKNILNILEREDNKDYFDKIKLAKKYFSNINIDLMYGIHGQTLDDLKKDLEKFILCDVTHISIYSLILEDNTKLKIRNFPLINEELCRDMYDYIVSFLEKHGFRHYEISNFAKKGYEAKHNLVYWNNLNYYGFGLGASGYIGNVRYTNTRNLTKYLALNDIREEEVLSLKVMMENELILGLRKIAGVKKADFYNKYHKRIEDVFNVSKLKENKDYFYIDKNDLYISNSILIDFIDT